MLRLRSAQGNGQRSTDDRQQLFRLGLGLWIPRLVQGKILRLIWLNIQDWRLISAATLFSSHFKQKFSQHYR
ncbi:hypothetical protein B0E43_03750 [Algoriphagus sp. A40]|nr:hypothetical protein B0E43_03750 [Algoriphagus sp. A40]